MPDRQRGVRRHTPPQPPLPLLTRPWCCYQKAAAVAAAAATAQDILPCRFVIAAAAACRPHRRCRLPVAAGCVTGSRATAHVPHASQCELWAGPLIATCRTGSSDRSSYASCGSGWGCTSGGGSSSGDGGAGTGLAGVGWPTRHTTLPPLSDCKDIAAWRAPPRVDNSGGWGRWLRGSRGVVRSACSPVATRVWCQPCGSQWVVCEVREGLVAVVRHATLTQK